MISMLPCNTKTIGAALVVTVLSAAVLPLVIQSSPLLMNYTDSVPVGLYRQGQNGAASYAGICLSRALMDRALRSGLEIALGSCQSGYAPILKPLVRASAAHPISFTAEGFLIDGKLLPNTAPKPRSTAGVALEHYPFGVYASGAWAISDFNRSSYDSRYFGPVDSDAIRFYAKPVWTW